MMRCLGLAEQLLADGHDVRVSHDKWPAEIVKKLPQGLNSDCDRFGVIEVIDSYVLKAVTRNAIDIGSKSFWFLRNELRDIPRGRERLSVLGFSHGGANASKTGEVVTDSEGVVYVTPTFDTYVKCLYKIDVMYGAFGVSSLERCYLGIPSLGLLISENQRPNAQAQVDAFAAINVACGHKEDSYRDCLTRVSPWLRTLRLNPDLVAFMSEKAMALVPHDSYQAFLDEVKATCLL